MYVRMGETKTGALLWAWHENAAVFVDRSEDGQLLHWTSIGGGEMGRGRGDAQRRHATFRAVATVESQPMDGLGLSQNRATFSGGGDWAVQSRKEEDD